MSTQQPDMRHPSLPWWRVPAVWLTVSGPAVVVIAGIVTTVIAVRGGDVPVRDVPVVTQPDANAPATQARNHVATPRR